MIVSRFSSSLVNWLSKEAGREACRIAAERERAVLICCFSLGFDMVAKCPKASDKSGCECWTTRCSNDRDYAPTRLPGVIYELQISALQ